MPPGPRRRPRPLRPLRNGPTGLRPPATGATRARGSGPTAGLILPTGQGRLVRVGSGTVPPACPPTPRDDRGSLAPAGARPPCVSCPGGSARSAGTPGVPATRAGRRAALKMVGCPRSHRSRSADPPSRARAALHGLGHQEATREGSERFHARLEARRASGAARGGPGARPPRRVLGAGRQVVRAVSVPGGRRAGRPRAAEPAGRVRHGPCGARPASQRQSSRSTGHTRFARHCCGGAASRVTAPRPSASTRTANRSTGGRPGPLTVA